MPTIPLLSTNTKLYERLTAIIQATPHNFNEIIQLTNTRSAIGFLTIEMPELIFINFSDPKINGFQLIEQMLKDPWLLHGGIIALSKEYATMERINEIKGANIIVSLTFNDLERELPRLLHIIHENRRILFQRGIGQDIVGTISGAFKLHNNLFEANCYVNLICNFLYNANKLTSDKKYFVHLALYEMLINAIEHGNCGITYNEKSKFLERGGCMPDLIEKKSLVADAAHKMVTLEYIIQPTGARFLIADEGDGFDWNAMFESIPKADNLRLHGRGMLITREIAKNFQYNEKGNEVTFEISYDTEGGSITPALFKEFEPIEVKQGEIVLNQNDPSNYLFFIVKGHYDIYVNETRISSLSPDDIFLGEMSFLLNDRRSATVRAVTDGKLVKISKMEFVQAIKKKPHYALFLAKLLAERIQRLNVASSQKK